VQSARVHVVAPVSFNDAQEIGDKLKVSQPVIVNLQNVDRDLARRIIDFSSGLAYGLGGQMDKVADQVFLLTPSNVEVSAEEKRRLQERGLYRSEGDDPCLQRRRASDLATPERLPHPARRMDDLQLVPEVAWYGLVVRAPVPWH